ncbi:MAG: FkbM family methyltransferase [Alphaproteobacteria bacterium]
MTQEAADTTTSGGPTAGGDASSAVVQAATASSTLLRARPCRHGTMLYLRHDAYVGRSLDLYGEYGEKEWMVLGQLVRPGDVAVEAGANLGSHTVPLARKVGPKGAVHAFEPQRVVFQIMCANVVINELTNVHAYNAAVGERAGSIEVPPVAYDKGNNFGGLSLDGVSNAKIVPGVSGETVPVMTIDALKLERLKLLKIDVEGMERAVLLGARETIARCRPFLYFEADREERNYDLISTAFEMGYRLFWHLPRLFNPENFDGKSDNVFGRIVSLNLLGVPKESDIAVKNLREVTSAQDTNPLRGPA